MLSSNLRKPKIKSRLRPLLYQARPTANALPNSGLSVRPVKQPAADNLSLDLGGSFKNIEYAGVAQDSGNRKFQGKAVTAMHLHRVVRRGPGYPRGQQLGHACFQITASSGIFFPRRMIGELSGDHYFNRRHHDLVSDPWKPNDRATELRTVLRVFECLLHRGLRNADGARSCLDTSRLECLHQLLEAEAFNATE